ncbi:MAG: GMC family oxidoreductase [Haloarculaceae archaeon]
MRGDRAPSEPVDVCVVGTGPAGAIPAAKLAERGHDVVVLEAGPRFDLAQRGRQLERALRPEFTTEAVWDMGGPRDRFTSSGSKSYALNASRVKAVGGTTLHWGGLTPRLHPEDFEKRTRQGVGVDWPIDYADLEPYYLAAEREMGVAGTPSQFGGSRSGPYPLPAFPPSYSDSLFAPACAELGIELHPAPRATNSEPYDGRSECLGYGTCEPVCPSGAKYDASVHVRAAEAAGARVLDRCPVRRLEHDESGERVLAARYTAPDGRTHRQRADQFVLAAGAVESIRLLLLSASDAHPDGLANSSGLVGEGFMEHFGITLTGRLDQPTRQHRIGFNTSYSLQYYPYDRGPEGTIILQPINNAGPTPAELAMREEPTTPAALDGDLDAPFDGDEWGDVLFERASEEWTNRRVGFNAWVEQFPLATNRVTLDRSKRDDHGDPVPDVSLAVDDRTERALERAEAVIRDVFAELGASDVRANSSPDDPWTANHHLGGLRMGRSPGESVVDPDLRAHDLSNLYANSGAVFPTGGGANPTLTIAALSLRLADHLDERLTSE